MTKTVVARGERRRACAGEFVARGAAGGVVGSAGEDDGRVLRAFRDDDDGVELDAVAHGDHVDALDVVVVGLGSDGMVAGQAGG